MNFAVIGNPFRNSGSSAPNTNSRFLLSPATVTQVGPTLCTGVTMAELSEDQRVGRNTQTESSKCHERQRFVDPLSFYSSNKVHVHTRLADFGRLPLNSSTSNLLRRELLARGYRQTLDRVNELEGHSGYARFCTLDALY